MGLGLNEGVSAATVLIQGLLSFFSPCVLPLLPVYIGYLSGGTTGDTEDGGRGYDRRRVVINTVFFVLGVGFSFFLLGLGMRAVGRFFSGNQLLFARIGGVIVILFGLYQLGVFGSSLLLMRERRLPVRFDKMAVSPLTALLMGFVFSFAWTPCVGPTLSSVLIMAASADNSLAGFVLVGVYTIGFAVPFLLTGIFTTSVLGFLNRHRGAFRYTVRISGALLILMGIMMMTGRMNSITGYLSRISGTVGSAVTEERTEETAEISEEETDFDDETFGGQPEDVETAEEKFDEEIAEEVSEEEQPQVFPAPDFTLEDQYGETHTLSDYRGKVVFLNFWATWCPPCRAEMPDIQALYEENEAADDSDLVILGVAFPDMGDETSEEGIRSFLEENGYTYPTVMDKDAELMLPYYITAYPTTYMIDRDGNIFGYVPGSMTRDMMDEVIRQTKGGGE